MYLPIRHHILSAGYWTDIYILLCRDYTTSTLYKIQKINISTGAFTTLYSYTQGASPSVPTVGIVGNALAFIVNVSTGSTYYPALFVVGDRVNAAINYRLGASTGYGKILPHAALEAPKLLIADYSGSSNAYAAIGYFTPYLATVNNLASAVTKTSAQTMQISYTLLEV
ncbi:MAG: hypothetical protein QM689_12795 [Oscillospiraceae bacterium]